MVKILAVGNSFSQDAAAATWYAAILQGNIVQSPYMPPGCGEKDGHRIACIKQIVNQSCKNTKRSYYKSKK